MPNSNSTSAPKKQVITKAQILHVLTVFVITPLAGFVTSWTAKHFPGLPTFTTGQTTAFFITGAGAALTAAIHYLHGLQIWERTVGRYIDVEELKPAVGEIIHASPPQANVMLHVHGAGSMSVQSDPPPTVKAKEETPAPPQSTSSPATPASQAISGV